MLTFSLSSSSARGALLFLALAAASVASPALAAAPVAPPPAPQAVSDQPTDASPQGAFVQSLGDKALAIIANKKLSPDERNAQFRAMLRESFDLNTIARFVIGRSWLTATPQQQQEYLDLFEALVVKTYSDRFTLYTGEGFKVRSSAPEGNKDFIVNSEITHPDGSKPTVVNWRIRQKGDKMGIIDVVVEGVSMSVTQRQEYSSVIQRNGGDIEGLLTLMRERVQGSAPQDVAKKG